MPTRRSSPFATTRAATSAIPTPCGVPSRPSASTSTAVFDEIATGKPLQTVREEHESTVSEHGTWGVPTFAVGDQASFVRLMHRPEGDGAGATRTIERVLDLLDWPELNEFKHPRLPR